MSSPFSQPSAKLTIGSLDEPGITVEAQYNPKELQVDQTVPWKKPDAANQTGSQQSEGGGDPIALEFTGAEGRTMSVELLFDEYEPANRAVDVAGRIAALETLARVRDPKSTDEKKRRPHQCVVAWGGRGLPSFKCVIESLSTKYMMFSSDGKPLRATCTVKLKEAHAVEKKAGGGANGGT
jgi:hypothetical protein